MQIKEESEVMEGLARINGDLYEDFFFAKSVLSPFSWMQASLLTLNSTLFLNDLLRNDRAIYL